MSSIPWHSLSASEALTLLQSAPEGLTSAEAARRLAASEALTEARTFENERTGLQLLAGGEGLALAKREISRRDVGSEWVIAEALEPLDGDFDMAIVDTGPGWDVLTINAIFASGAVLAPVSLEPLALMGLGYQYLTGVLAPWLRTRIAIAQEGTRLPFYERKA